MPRNNQPRNSEWRDTTNDNERTKDMPGRACNANNDESNPGDTQNDPENKKDALRPDPMRAGTGARTGAEARDSARDDDVNE